MTGKYIVMMGTAMATYSDAILTTQFTNYIKVDDIICYDSTDYIVTATNSDYVYVIYWNYQEQQVKEIGKELSRYHTAKVKSKKGFRRVEYYIKQPKPKSNLKARLYK